MQNFRILVENRIRFIVCNERVMRTIYGMLMILGCAWGYAFLFSLVTLLSGGFAQIGEIWVRATKIAMPVALLVGYMVWTEVPMQPTIVI